MLTFALVQALERVGASPVKDARAAGRRKVGHGPRIIRARIATGGF
jgi:hypothetical protein